MIFNDPVHGHIALHPLCIKIIDTPQFQRLRHIKQLSLCDYVYPGAVHTRFEHSLGTCHLAGELVKHLMKQDPDLGINDKDVLCVEISALCHDLGHGPFSHLWEEFMGKVKPDANWKHEEMSVKMLNYLIAENNLEMEFEKYFGDHLKQYKAFMKLLIIGSAQDRMNNPWKLEGEEDKSFLYEVVSNNDTGMDVDKWDYISRDCHHVGFKHGFCHDRIIRFSRIIEADGRKRLCIQYKELLNLYSMYNARFILHSRVYHHNVSKIIDNMVLDALVLVNEHITYQNSHKRCFSMADAALNLHFFTMMTDSIFQRIIYSTEKKLEPARLVLERIHKRDLYKYVGEMKLRDNNISLQDLEEKVFQNLPDCANVVSSDILCVRKKVGFGMKGKNPLFETYFYGKCSPVVARRLDNSEISRLLPNGEDCEEEYAVFFCRRSEENILQNVKIAFANAFPSVCNMKSHF